MTPEKKYKAALLKTENIMLVQNPNGGPWLAFSLDSGVELLEVQDGEYTYAFKDLNKNGILDPYEDWRLTSEERAADLANRLTIEQIAGLMLYPVGEPQEDGSLSESVIRQLDEMHIRFLLSNFSNKSNSKVWNNKLQAHVEKNDPYGIPVSISSDPRNTVMGGRFVVYDDSNMSGWPGNLGLAATFNPELVLKHGQITSKEYRAFGISTALSPQVDLATEPRWSRFAGTFGEGSKLASDMAAAYVQGFQSTWNGIGKDADDLGWGKDSVITMIKHFPGDGAAESGREAHNNFGKFNVYPGSNFVEHYNVFNAAFKIKDSKTGGAKAVMPSYSIAVGNQGPIGRPVGSGYSKYKLTDLLENQLGFDGLVCCDWDITSSKPWGVEDIDTLERHYRGIMAGLHMFGGSNDMDANKDAYEFGLMANRRYVKLLHDMPPEIMAMFKHKAEGPSPEEIMNSIYINCAKKCLQISFYNGLFENPYVVFSESDAVMANMEYKKEAFEAQKASLILLKNRGNLLRPFTAKKTVYIPMVYTPSHMGFPGMPGIPATISTPINNCTELSCLFDVVTDEIRVGANPKNLLESDIIRRTDFTGVYMAIVTANSPDTGHGFDQACVCIEKGKPLDNGYRPVSLQYGEYYADPAFVRPYSMGLDPEEEIMWQAAGGESGKSRYYGGKTVTARNGSFIATLKRLREILPHVPIALYLTVTNPMCFYEFEPLVDAVLVGFSVSDEAALEVLSGRYEPNGLLPCQMPANMRTVETQKEDVPFDMECHKDSEGHIYDYGFGMDWNGPISDWRTEKYGRGAYLNNTIVRQLINNCTTPSQ